MSKQLTYNHIVSKERSGNPSFLYLREYYVSKSAPIPCQKTLAQCKKIIQEDFLADSKSRAVSSNRSYKAVMHLLSFTGYHASC